MARNIVDDIFSNEVQLTISEICDSTEAELITNHRRADALSKLLKKFGFKELGCGTNRIVFTHKNIPDKAFKIALDSRGIMDNNMEEKLFKDLIDYVPQFYDNNGLILIAERVNVFKHSSDYYTYADEIEEIINSIAPRYVLNDIGPKSFLNWGIDNVGRIVILDYAYLTPIDGCNTLVCRKCGSPLSYNEDMTMIECTYKKCKAIYGIADIAGSHVDTLTELGFIDETFEDDIEAKKEMVKGEDIDDVLEKMGFVK